MKNALRALRIAMGLTQEELAEKLGVKRQTIVNIERGHVYPRADVMLRIGAFFRTPVDAIFFLDDDEEFQWDRIGTEPPESFEEP